MNSYLICLIVGGTAAAMVPVGYLVSLLVQTIWAFIDESKVGPYNWFVHLICKIYGYTLSNGDGTGVYTHIKKNGRKTDGDNECFLTVGVLFLLPLIVWTATQFYPITLTALTVTGVVFLARFSRRTFKRLAKHEKDPNAHKVTE